MAAQIWQHDAAQILIFQPQRPPFMVEAFFRESVPHSVRIHLRFTRREYWERGNRVGRSFLVGWERKGVLSDAYLAKHLAKTRQRDRNEERTQRRAALICVHSRAIPPSGK